MEDDLSEMLKEIQKRKKYSSEYLKVLEPVFGCFDIYDSVDSFNQSIKALDPEMVNIASVHLLDSEVRNGRFHHFF